MKSNEILKIEQFFVCPGLTLNWTLSAGSLFYQKLVVLVICIWPWENICFAIYILVTFQYSSCLINNSNHKSLAIFTLIYILESFISNVLCIYYHWWTPWHPVAYDWITLPDSDAYEWSKRIISIISDVFYRWYFCDYFSFPPSFFRPSWVSMYDIYLHQSLIFIDLSTRQLQDSCHDQDLLLHYTCAITWIPSKPCSVSFIDWSISLDNFWDTGVGKWIFLKNVPVFVR